MNFRAQISMRKKFMMHEFFRAKNQYEEKNHEAKNAYEKRIQILRVFPLYKI